MELIGREREKKQLTELFRSKSSEFLALYGRRRVGKTFLIVNFFQKQSCRFLYASGMQEGTLHQQLENFTDAVSRAFLSPSLKLEVADSWMKAFAQLTELMENEAKNQKLVLFFDEMPWMATKRSQFLQALDYYWNRFWVHDSRVKLIVCGSAASWIIRNIIHNKGGLYNRVTLQIRLDPFTLSETRAFLKARKLNLTIKQITELYMVTGGIPYYLARIKKGNSAVQMIQSLAFDPQGILYKDFEYLFSSLFENADEIEKVVRLIAESRYGILQEDLLEKAPVLKRGGSGTRRLNDLEEAGFILGFLPYMRKRKGISYRLIDEYCNFYLQWIEPERNSIQKMAGNGRDWNEMRRSPRYFAWAGYTFEMLCYKHIPKIREALGLTSSAKPYTWFVSGNDQTKGAQIDLLFDREDDAITLCEIKYTEKPFRVDKAVAENWMRKKEVFQKKTGTTKQIFFALISASGITPTFYSEELIDGLVTLKMLF